jgi:hypothetical protein
MKRIIILPVLVFSAIAAQAQTRLIALKSHSGSSSGYRAESFGNFGIIQLPVVTLEKVEKLNDSTVITLSRTEEGLVVDTLMHHPQFSGPDVTEESLRKLYNNQVEFKNFDSLARQPFDQKPPASGNPEKQPENPQHSPRPSEKTKEAPDRQKNFLLLLVIGGGTFLGGGMIAAGRRRKNVPNYA